MSYRPPSADGAVLAASGSRELANRTTYIGG